MLLNTPKKLLYSQGNAQIITFSNLRDSTTGSVLNTDSITGNMIDCNGNLVPGCTNVILNSQDTLGDYLGTFGDNTFYPPVGTGYTLLIDGNDGADPPGGCIHFEVMVEIVARQQ